jgi:hypothetical protein
MACAGLIYHQKQASAWPGRIRVDPDLSKPGPRPSWLGGSQAGFGRVLTSFRLLLLTDQLRDLPGRGPDPPWLGGSQGVPGSNMTTFGSHFGSLLSCFGCLPPTLQPNPGTSEKGPLRYGSKPPPLGGSQEVRSDPLEGSQTTPFV